MSSETKKIVVNLDSVKPSKQVKTRKNVVPKISPNSLKNELLQKIKNHKTNNSKTIVSEKDSYTDEFYKSIDYLNSIKEKMNNTRKRTPMNKRGVTNPSLVSSNTPSLLHTPSLSQSFNNSNVDKYIQMELPDELEETKLTPVNNTVFEIKPTNNHNYTSKASYHIDKDVPHGCLKNGIKPCYRNWKNNQTRRQPLFEESGLSNREMHLQRIKQNMIQNKEQNEENIKFMIQEPLSLQTDEPDIQSNHNDNVSFQESTPTIVSNPTIVSTQSLSHTPPIVSTPQIVSAPTISNNVIQPVQLPKKTFIKKTITKKHSLGKSSKFRKVGVLIKNRSTRKQIIDAQRELKKTPMHVIKKQLKKQGLIKVGSTAPNDIIKETYECAVLAGEITNKNSDVLFHNFMNDAKEE